MPFSMQQMERIPSGLPQVGVKNTIISNLPSTPEYAYLETSYN